MYVCMDGWILTVDLLPVRRPDPGTPPADRGGHCATHTHVPDPTRTHCKQGPTGCKQSGMYKPSLLNQPADLGKTGHSKPPPSPKESSLQEETPKHMVFLYAKVYMYVCMYVCMYGWMDGWMNGWIDRWMDNHCGFAPCQGA